MEEKFEIEGFEDFADIVLQVCKRLKYLGYEIDDSDDENLAFCVEKVINEVKLLLNRDELPISIKQILIDRIIGEFLSTRIDKISDEKVDETVKKIVEGDVSVEFFAEKSKRQYLYDYIDRLKNSNNNILIKLRCLKW